MQGVYTRTVPPTDTHNYKHASTNNDSHRNAFSYSIYYAVSATNGAAHKHAQLGPTNSRSNTPTITPSASPTLSPSESPSTVPTTVPSSTLTNLPPPLPRQSPSVSPTSAPSIQPSFAPSFAPSIAPRDPPTSALPSNDPSTSPTNTLTAPSAMPTVSLSQYPTIFRGNPTPVPVTEPPLKGTYNYTVASTNGVAQRGTYAVLTHAFVQS